MESASASGGVATIENAVFKNPQITIVPASASGTAALTVKPVASGADYESALDSSGTALSFALTGQATYRLDGVFYGIKVTSSNAADTFTMSVSC